MTRAMTGDEFKDKLKQIKEKADAERLLLAKEFAMSHNRVKVGDFIEQSGGYIIKVKSIELDPDWDEHYLPYCFYSGTRMGMGKDDCWFVTNVDGEMIAPNIRFTYSSLEMLDAQWYTNQVRS